MESSSYENYDEIEMLLGHLVIGNLLLVIGNRQLVDGVLDIRTISDLKCTFRPSSPNELDLEAGNLVFRMS